MLEIHYDDLSHEDLERMRRNIPLSIKSKCIIKYSDGVVEHYNDGMLHNDSGPSVIYPSGTKFWHKNGLLHRTDGPAAVYYDGGSVWCENGKKHRLDGPAFIDESFQLWFINDVKVSEEDVQTLLNTKKSEEVKAMMLLKYSK